MRSRPFLTAEWRYLAMLNYAVDPAVLRPLVPPGTELDAWEGRTLVSMVGFRFLHTKVRGLAIPGHRDFDEVNLRFYVRRRGPEGWRRGVVFVREIVPRPAIAWVARFCYNEPYLALPMRHQVQMDGAEAGAGGSLAYEWRYRGRWNRLEAQTIGSPAVPQPGSEAEFITEHYWGYNRRSDHVGLEYRVEHPPWAVWPVRSSTFDCDVDALYGAGFDEPLSGPPCSAFVAVGSAVTVYSGAVLPSEGTRGPTVVGNEGVESRS